MTDEITSIPFLLCPRICHVSKFNSDSLARTGRQERISGCYELGFFFSTSGGSYRAGKEWHRIDYGDIRFCAPGTAISSRGSFSCYTIYFDLPQGEAEITPLLEKFPAFFPGGNKFEEIFRKIHELSKSDLLVMRLEQNGTFLCLLSALSELLDTKGQYHPGVILAMEYMDSHLGETVHLETLGKLTGYSPTHLCRLFKSNLGKSPHEYLLSLRVKHAAELLTTTSYNIFTIASLCGFSSESHFKKLFKSYYGITPGAYRRKGEEII